MQTIKFLLVLTVIVFYQQTLFSQVNSEEQAIKITALNYIEGWYKADTARMAAALSPDLVKRGLVLNHQTNTIQLMEASYVQMLEWTGKKPNEFTQNPAIEINVQIIEIGKNMAMVKTISPQFIDYIHMAKLNGQWKIYNVMWEPR